MMFAIRPPVLNASRAWPEAFTDPETLTVCVTLPRVTVAVRGAAVAWGCWPRSTSVAPPAIARMRVTTAMRPGPAERPAPAVRGDVAEAAPPPGGGRGDAKPGDREPGEKDAELRTPSTERGATPAHAALVGDEGRRRRHEPAEQKARRIARVV